MKLGDLSNKSKTILKILKEFGEFSAPILFPKSLSFGKYKIARALRQMLESEWPQGEKELEKYKNSFSVTLSRLRSQGLIYRRGSRRESTWQLTEKGNVYLQTEAESKKIINDGKIRLVIFDIPEKERNKRRWLRSRLLLNCYKVLQKSVWFGLQPLPESLLKEIIELKMEKFVHILSLGDKGTLEKIL